LNTDELEAKGNSPSSSSASGIEQLQQQIEAWQALLEKLGEIDANSQ
jgi:hypothetical protein